jgi:hypothetical protein
MSAYRYILFPRGRQPTKEEVDELKRHGHVLANRVAYGTRRDDGSLAIAFEATVFDYALATERGFEALVRAWQHHGCELLDHLAFVKDATALRPTTSNMARLEYAPAHDDLDQRQASAKLAAAKEATARSRLRVEQTLDRIAMLQRLGTAIPYVLIGLGALGTIVAGLYVGSRLTNPGRERRQETIQRVLEETAARPQDNREAEVSR